MGEYKSSIYNIEITEKQGWALVYNSFSGAVAWFEEQYMDAVLHDDMTLIKENGLFQPMLEKGFIIGEGVDQWALANYERFRAIFREDPENVTFIIAPSMKCNYHCLYCFENTDAPKNTMSEIAWEHTIAYIKKFVDNHSNLRDVYISWFGGEPTLQIENILKYSKQLQDYIQKRGVHYQARIITNGSLLTKDVAWQMANECNVQAAQITLDGLGELYAKKKGTTSENFYRTIQNIKDACDLFRIIIRINIDRDNVQEIENLLALLLDESGLNGKILVDFAMIQNWNDEEEIKNTCLTESEYITFIKDIHRTALVRGWGDSFMQKLPRRHIVSCGMLHVNNCVIGPDEKLYRCSHMLNREGWEIGNLQDGLLHNGTDLRFLLDSADKRCRTCKAFPVCGGGCIANRLIHNKSQPICREYIDWIRENVLFALKCKNQGNN